MKYDEENKKLWFTSTKTSSIKCIDLEKRNIERLQKESEEISD